MVRSGATIRHIQSQVSHFGDGQSSNLKFDRWVFRELRNHRVKDRREVKDMIGKSRE